MRWIIVTEEGIYSSIFSELFFDVLKQKNVLICNQYLADSGIKKRCISILLKRRVDKILNGCVDLLLQPHYELYNFFSCTDINIVVFLNAAFQKIYTERRLKKIKNKFPNTKFILLFVDAVFQKQAKNAFGLTNRNLFDLIYTFDRNDANKYGFIYMNTPYSKTFDYSLGEGVYFCGSDKGRTKELIEIAKRLSELKVKYQFDVYGNEELSNSYFKVRKSGYKKYTDIVLKTLEFNCIIDLVQKGRKADTGLSLRVYEATVYNKVLITNNINILDYQFYNPLYMHYIEDASNIKMEWIFDTADYRYNNEFSPTHFFENIYERIK